MGQGLVQALQYNNYGILLTTPWVKYHSYVPLTDGKNGKTESDRAYQLALAFA